MEKETIDELMKGYNDKLIAKNNSNNADEGVTKVLLAIEKPSINALKAGREIGKKQNSERKGEAIGTEKTLRETREK